MPLLEKRTDRIPVAVVQDGDAANQVGTFLIFGNAIAASARFRAVAGDALRVIDSLAPIRAGGIDHMRVKRRGCTSATSAAGSSAASASRGSGPWS